MPGSLPHTDVWLRRRTLLATALLGYARLLIALVPLRLWRNRFGLAPPPDRRVDAEQARTARTLARHVNRAAARLPFARKCLPRAMALSLLLRRSGIAHCMVFAVRPSTHSVHGERLHAWIEQDGYTLIGDEPGPWVEILRLGQHR